MEESSDVEAIKKISTEVDESQFKIILTSQCIKAQACLVNKLRKQSEHQREVCNFINVGNFTLQTEIKLADQEIQSQLTALETIKCAYIDKDKELLLSKERNAEIQERVNNGINKYEKLWSIAKKRYENIPIINKHMQIKNKGQLLQENIKNLDNEYQLLSKEINKKKCELYNSDVKRILKLADYMVNERINMLECINKEANEIKGMREEIQKIKAQIGDSNLKVIVSNTVKQGKLNTILKDQKNIFIDDSWPNLSKNNDNESIMTPKLQLQNIDLDILTVKLDQIKRDNSQSKVSLKRMDSASHEFDTVTTTKKNKPEEFITDAYISSYFKTPYMLKNQKQESNINYSDKKLIHILEDIKLDKNETYNLVKKLKPNKLQSVMNIEGDDSKSNSNNFNKFQEKEYNLMKDDQIEEIDLTKKSNILVPPTQFMDLSQGVFTKSQEQMQNFQIDKTCSQEKRVTFNTIISVQEAKTMDTELEKSLEDDNVADETFNSQLNISNNSDNSFKKIKETVFKKHNLDLSPQFTYTKISVAPKKSENNIITSKFFDEKDNNNNQTNKNVATEQEMEIEDNEDARTNLTQYISSSPNSIKVVKEGKNEASLELPVAGFLFNHGPQGISDSLNLSISTTGYEDGDAEFPHCIDSSLLLSPKADLQPSTSENDNVKDHSQEVPNFLSGLRKTGFSFFGNRSENKSDNDPKVQNNNFNFTFGGGDEKKSRSGLFSMFH